MGELRRIHEDDVADFTGRTTEVELHAGVDEALEGVKPQPGLGRLDELHQLGEVGDSGLPIPTHQIADVEAEVVVNERCPVAVKNRGGQVAAKGFDEVEV